MKHNQKKSFNKIHNPVTGKWVNINGNVGKNVLRNYLHQSGGSDPGVSSKSDPGKIKTVKKAMKHNNKLVNNNAILDAVEEKGLGLWTDFNHSGL